MKKEAPHLPEGMKLTDKVFVIDIEHLQCLGWGEIIDSRRGFPVVLLSNGKEATGSRYAFITREMKKRLIEGLQKI